MNENQSKNKRIQRKKRERHGDTGTPFYHRWKEMLERCHDPKNKDYEKYGARGIKVCERWHSYNHFKEDSIQMGYHPSLTLDRIDNEKGYSSENCRYITRLEQANNKRNNVFIEYNGERYTVAQWARRFKLTSSAIHSWLKYGTVEKNMKKYIDCEQLHNLPNEENKQ